MQLGLLPTVSIHCHFDNFRVAVALADPSAIGRTAPNAQSSGHHISESPCSLVLRFRRGAKSYIDVWRHYAKQKSQPPMIKCMEVTLQHNRLK